MIFEGFGPGEAYSTRLIGPPDLRSMQSLFERCSDYFKVATGAPPQPDEASRAFVAGPPSKSVDDKRVVGVFANDDLIGVVDAMVDWPEPGIWSVGMLMLDPGHRGNGLGSSLLGAFEEWSRSQGARGLRTAIVSHHGEGVSFLERHGFNRESAIDGYNAGAQVSSILFFEKKMV